ncbi:MAG: outer-membrane lipoprotein carrier protein LolA [Endomicrobium sp.]|jgi:chaperone LolA|nr:outer-membrane lipoprotein carrier protein LolA [Endomicrobium sp.]
MIKFLLLLLLTRLKLVRFGTSILFLTFCVYNIKAQEISGELSEFLLKLEQSDKKTNTIKADFVQTISFELTGEKQKIVGTVFLKKPNSLYINQRTPQEQRIYIDGKTITIYTPSESQAVTDTWKNSINEDFSPVLIVNFGSSWKDIRKTNNITLEGHDNNSVIIKIQPLKNKDVNAKIYISKASMLPEKAIINSAITKIEIVFKNYSLNPELSKDIFKLKISNNVEIIKL